MPEFVHSFTSGRMNKDLDERLIPNGEYRDALNLDLANSEGANIGTLQNVKGNREQRGCEGCSENWSADYIDALQDPVVIGSIRHDKTERIYWFIAAPTKTGSFPYGVSAIAEYDQVTDLVKPVLVDTAGILKFSQDYLITGINILDNFLFWTDDQTEPKKINIEKFKAGSYNFTNHTKIPIWNPDVIDPNLSPYTQTTASTAAGLNDFIEEDITVAKLSPLTPPSINKAESEFGVGVYGTGLTPVNTVFNATGLFNFTYVPDPINLPFEFISYPTYGQYEAILAEGSNFLGTSFDDAVNNPNYDATYGWTGEVTFEIIESDAIPLVWESGNIIKLTAEFDNEYGQIEDYAIQMEIVAINNQIVTGRIQAISSDIPRILDPLTGESTPLNWEIVLEEKNPLFKYIFPRFAYRWKYIDNEYSCFSPFSEVAFIGSEFEYASSDGYNIGMTNNIRKLFIESLTWGSDEVDELDILYKESNSTAVYVVDTLKKKDYAPYGSLQNLPTLYEIKTELITKIVESNQILRPWDNVPKKAKAQEIIGNRVVYGNYTQNYTISNTVKLNASLFSQPHPAQIPSLPPNTTDDVTVNLKNLPEPSLKSIRTYQLGVVFKDQFGRETPVFTSEKSGIQVPISESLRVTALQASPQGNPPDDPNITHYKFFIKETANEYYNLALDRFYYAEDGNVWLSFPSSERNKVDEETYLILKKQHDNDVAINSLNEYKILSISNEAPEFISTFDAFKIGQKVNLNNEIEPGFLSIQFNGPNSTDNPFFGPNLNSGSKIEIVYLGVTSEKYGIVESSVDGSSYIVTLETPIGAELPVISSGTDVTINIFTEETKNLPEFEGRFFVKINRDFAFDTNIVASFAALEEKFAVKDEVDLAGTVHPYNDGLGNDISGYWFGDRGQNHSINGCGGKAGERFLLGNGWGGAGSGENGGCQWELQQGYRPPQNGQITFGFLKVIHNGSWAFIDKMVGHTAERWQARSIDGFLSPGSRIRFKFKNGEYSKVYTISDSVGRYTPRGGRMYKNGCRDRNQNWNYKYAVIITLTQQLQEANLPNDPGDWSTLDNIASIQHVEPVRTFGNKLLSSTNPAIFETQPKEAVDLNLFYEASGAIPISNYNNPNQKINWFNCFSFGNGVESNRIRDDYNAILIDKGAKVSTTLDEPYAEERRGSGFIFSQIYNSTSGINRLNQFIQAEPITKDLNPVHGTIQKLHARDTDLITLCEDKCFRVLANKDALYNADGNVNLTGNNSVLGQAVPYAGEFGISKNPESFASYGFRVYFSDKNRGTVIRLSRDGITEISTKGMNDFFENNLRFSKNIIGSYDSEKGLYNITLDNLSQEWQNTLSEDRDYQLSPDCNTNTASPVLQTTISFKEEVDGWTSRKSFIQESGVSLNNRYYTFKNGRIWEHGLNILANNFYGVQYDSAFNVVFNEMPQSVKGFSTLNYTGTQSRLLEYLSGSRWYSIAEVNASPEISADIINPLTYNQVQQKQPGWYVNYVKTDLEGGEVKEFKKKEGKWFNYIKGLEQFNDCEIIGDGIGPPVIVECDPQDYVLTVTVDEDCSGSGSITPDTLFTGWYHWTYKGSLNGNIVNEPTAQDAKCVIDDFYTLDSGVTVTYSAISVASEDFMYVFTDGINPGTQMYDSNTLQPLTESGTYLYIQSPSGATPDNSALDPNNPMPVPATYSIVIWGNDGIIDSVTQYNTLSTCNVVEPPEEYGWVFAKYISNEFPYSNPPTPVITPYLADPTDTSQEIVCKHKTAVEEFNNSVFPTCPNQNTCRTSGSSSVKWRWYGPNQGGTETIQLGTIIRDSNGNPQTYAQAGVYNAGQGPGVGYVPSMTYWSDITTMPDDWHVVITNNSGEVIVFQRINELSNSCP